MKFLLLTTIVTGAAAWNLSAKLCQDFDLTVTVTSSNFVFGAPKFNNNFDITDFVTDLTSREPPKTFSPLLPDKINQTGTYKIGSTFCAPSNPHAPNRYTVIFATHGLNFDRTYWDSGFQPEKYSFVDYAISQGYSVFYYDRLGVGSSSIVSGYINQLPIQSEIAKQLARIVKSGRYPGSIGKPKSLVIVGHSFGSSISAAVAASEPDIADGLILTGFSYNGSNPNNFALAAQLKIASSLNPAKWNRLDTGYVTPVDIYANVNGFFKAPDYDLAVAEYTEYNKAPFAIGEFLTVTAIDILPVAFKGVAMVIAGQRDFIVCQSQCDDVIEHPAAEIFSQASAFKAVSYPGSGHGINFALNATGAYEEIFSYLGANGL
ncbi:hypothetical protein LHYA1_G008564 [Lachnellula hyalina]|uniref:AB hydrolase-1 domain-containing protein n=1 Tax=Lachnellula hyalina TaxID=1316788 RepID=A0A8H8TW72_9HELO|nr:uncharacterized protein LHYA1_G008564 [Lachnellula hyalina]TVY22612.1 hypothetical protein LHYA1_G008564 [Lachnellula hyalina]